MSERIEDARQLVADAMTAHGERRCRLFVRARRALYSILYTREAFAPLLADVDLHAWIARDVNAPDVTEDERLVLQELVRTVDRARMPDRPSVCVSGSQHKAQRIAKREQKLAIRRAARREGNGLLREQLT